MFWTRNADCLTSQEQAQLSGTPEVELTLVPSKRARRMSLRVSKLDGRVRLTVPKGTSRREALSFAEERAEWIRGHVSGMTARIRPGFGDLVPVLGRPRKIVPATSRATRLGEETIAVPDGDERTVAVRVETLLKQHARATLSTASDHYAAAVGRRYAKLTLRDTRSRWGSCSSQGNLSYSWRLIMAPEDVLNYVAAHEVSHLVHMDHSPAFWAQVEEIFPRYRDPRTWLKSHGADLHRYRFRD